jgi:hypothetical protein
MQQANVRGFFVGSCLLGAALLALSQSASAQPPGFFYPPTAMTPKIPPTGVVLQAADALGMVRGLGENIFDAVNRIEFNFAGVAYVPVHGASWKEVKIPSATLQISYHQAASRLIIDRVDAAGAKAHAIEVVDGPYAWNEQTPGVGGVPAMQSVAERARWIWLTPQGFIYQVEQAGPQRTKIGKSHGKTTLSVTIDGEPVTATLGADHRPELIEAKIRDPDLGTTNLTIEYSGYKDFDYYGIMFPSHITAKLGGHPELDVTVTSFLTHTYFLFPKPDGIAQLVAKSAK